MFLTIAFKHKPHDAGECPSLQHAGVPFLKSHGFSIQGLGFRDLLKLAVPNRNPQPLNQERWLGLASPKGSSCADGWDSFAWCLAWIHKPRGPLGDKQSQFLSAQGLGSKEGKTVKPKP